MAVENWSETVRVVHLSDDPQFSEDILALDPLPPRAGVVLDFSGVRFVNSSNIAKLLTLRKRLAAAEGRLLFCGMKDHVWSAFLVTGLDKLFEQAPDVSTALASLQLGIGASAKR
jgi:anti-anti-sigma factor